MKRLRLAAFVLVCGLAAGCAAPTSFVGYLENRRQDLIDVVHVDIGMINGGAVVYVLPFVVGLDYQTGVTTRKASDTIQIGLGGPRILGRDGVAGGLLVPSSRWDEDKPLMGPRPKRAPSGYSVGFSLGVFVGVGAEADVLELVDFLFGLVCLDIMRDDVNVVAPKAPPAIQIEVGPAGILLAGKAVTADELRTKLAELAEDSPKTPVRIVLGPTVPYADALSVYASCVAAGLTNVTIVGAPDSTPTPGPTPAPGPATNPAPPPG